jgi:hypothetical protein
MIKRIRLLASGLLLIAAAPILAQEDISGVWSGMLPVGPDATLEIHFVFTRTADGGYSAMLTSPNPDGVQDVPATSTSFDGQRLELAVDALAGRYEGTLADGSFSGNWIQQGTEIPLSLAPYVERSLSDAAKAALRGSWVGELNVQGVMLAIVFRFEDDDAGEFVGFLDSPDQGASGIPVTNIEFENGDLSFEIAQIRGGYAGTVSGASISGTFTQLGQPMPLNMARGEYLARGIELSPDDIDRLEGSWVGKVQNPAGGELTIVFRFEGTDDGRLVAYLDSPDQGASGVPINEISLEGDSLSLVIAAARASFTATLAAAEMTGNWAQGNNAQTVTMTRGEYTPTVAALDLSDAAMQQLAGAWRGTMGPLELIVRFETTAGGAKAAFLDVPAQGANGLSIPQVALEGDQLSFTIPAISATFTGTVSGNEAQGTWAQGPANNPLTLTREP